MRFGRRITDVRTNTGKTLVALNAGDPDAEAVMTGDDAGAECDIVDTGDLWAAADQ